MSGFRRTDTDNFCFRLRNRWFRDPQIILQRQYRVDEDKGYARERWETTGHYWRDVTLQDLTIMSLKQLISPREGDEMPTCFKPQRKLFGWCLVLQVLEGSYEHNLWRDARAQDLHVKDGKIQGGLGLVAR